MAKKLRQIIILDEIAIIPLTQGYEAVVDAADVGVVSGRNWSADVHRRTDGTIRCVYAVSRINYEKVSMHRLLCGLRSDKVVDHRDGDGLNNRRSSNLRIASHQQNIHNSRRPANNTSGAKGVVWHANRWIAQIKVDGRRINLGRYLTREEAEQAYAAASAREHGEFGRTA